jgi:hypothetical protein
LPDRKTRADIERRGKAYSIKYKLQNYWCDSLGESFEFGFQKKVTKLREELSKKEVDIRRKVTDIQKIKVEALKKTEEMKYSAQHDVEKISQDVMETKDLGAEVKTRLTSEIADLKNEIERKYSELRNTIMDKTTS